MQPLQALSTDAKHKDAEYHANENKIDALLREMHRMEAALGASLAGSEEPRFRIASCDPEAAPQRPIRAARHNAKTDIDVSYYGIYARTAYES